MRISDRVEKSCKLEFAGFEMFRNRALIWLLVESVSLFSPNLEKFRKILILLHVTENFTEDSKNSERSNECLEFILYT